MNRAVKSIFLLLTFLVIVVHGMVPHHHEENDFGERVNAQSDEGACHLDELTDAEHAHCNFQNIQADDNHHDCPHHFHNCQVNNLEFNYSKKNVPIRYWRNSSVLLKNSSCLTECQLAGIKKIYADLTIPFNKCFRISTLPLRAPPRFV